jgi:TonB family protein
VTSQSYWMILSALGFVLFCRAVGPDLQGSGPQPQQNPPTTISKSGGAPTDSPITRVQPEYPAPAKASHVRGQVIVEVTIDEEGSVIAASAISGHQLLKDAAVGAARQWKFPPTTLQGTSVKVVGMIRFSFKMDSSGKAHVSGEASTRFHRCCPTTAKNYYTTGRIHRIAPRLAGMGSH